LRVRGPWRTANTNSGRVDPEKCGVRTAHQNDGSSFALHLQEMRPGSLKVFPFRERDQVMPIEDQRPLQSTRLLSQRLQLLGPACGPRSSIFHSIVRVRATACTQEHCGGESDSSFHGNVFPKKDV